ncbi:MAG TPA: pyridine nucleotide-disulfide oxidoreductase [Firmicutes bacterium]|jgi:NADPH-dependent 2,4-dienoyl-CoA reductase/sulfur reductase-like enzyme|nr:pyridine nucleotide-disulfide oxidoreductase [Bacillota bacterium]HAZ22680.1 pyridine nucleotide-disulfide oxidoreductase [Bacillota bacterium]HBG43818.1 pyridine nucleotide-disulfide oxidoreductase [Bacillota bacterium]HBL48933.1 pyridine nucleotide-disulfide oxidoreductase [Bacillota bacterium]HBL69353.1 pyridine nucleotide-disulfide oxidoreductase [Bacillota bacterium]
MPVKKQWDVVVIGAGPAGLAAAIAACDSGADVCIIEREKKTGGVLKQCIHDGFGLIRFGERLSGPEYAYRYHQMVSERGIPVISETYLLGITKNQTDGKFLLQMQNSADSIFILEARAVVAATGCRERTARQVFIHGDRPAGILTAGTAQYIVNIQGFLPTRRCVILGSGDIGLIMARRLTLEGAEVEGVYEIKPEPSGLTRNIQQCLTDFEIPLHLSATVLAVHGKRRVESVVIGKVDQSGQPITGTERTVPCDALILSVGLIPENEIIEPLGVEMDRKTGGPIVDQNMMTSLDGLFACGNAVHVNDLVDYVSESGQTAGKAAAAYANVQQQRGLLSERRTVSARRLINIQAAGNMHYIVPQRLDLAHHVGADDGADNCAAFYFRSRVRANSALLRISAGKTLLEERRYAVVRPPEMERITLNLADLNHICSPDWNDLPGQSRLIKAELVSVSEGGDSANDNG